MSDKIIISGTNLANSRWARELIFDQGTTDKLKYYEFPLTPIHPYIEDVIFNNPATIVFWTDKTKTVVKCGDGDIYDPEKGLSMAIAKKFFGNQGNYYNHIRKWLPKNSEDDSIAEYCINDITATLQTAADHIRNAFKK